MRLPALAASMLILATFALAAVPTADALPGRCPPPYTGVWVDTPQGPVFMCCDFNQDPIPCYSRP